MKRMKTKNTLMMILFVIIVALSACTKIDTKNIETGKNYVGIYQGKDCVVVFDQTDEGNVKGRVYVNEGRLEADPIPFTCDLNKGGRGALRISDSEKNIKKASISEGSMKINVDGVNIVLKLQEMVADFKPMYREPVFDVAMEKGRVYAHNVKGYWSTYPDTGEGFGTIYIKKVSNLLSSKDLDLDMDIYYPKGQDIPMHRPLLVLIHGGAFYNGDKQAVGYPEMGSYFAERGYVVASINYRLGFMPIADEVDRAGYRALQDAHAAVCYLIDHAKEYGIDTSRIFAAGTSAGAITALNLAFMREEDRPESTRDGGAFKKFYSVLGLDADLGPINAVSGYQDSPFQIKAVVNMWGAVHTLEMLQNSPQTGLISFHGDLDRIVPYDYGYPFDRVLEPHLDEIFDNLPLFLQPIAKWGRDWIADGKPINEWAFNPMQGSKAIHDKMFSQNRHTELHTCYGGGHSLHMDDYRRLSDYFTDTIIPNMNRFLCEEMVEGKLVRIDHQGNESPWFISVDKDNVSELHWFVEGGAVVRNDEDKAKVLLFSDAPIHSVMVCGKYNNGVEFREKCVDK